MKLRDWVKTNYTDPPRDETTPEWIEEQRQEVAAKLKTSNESHRGSGAPSIREIKDALEYAASLAKKAAPKAAKSIFPKETPLEKLAKHAPVTKGKRPPEVKPPSPAPKKMPPKTILNKGKKLKQNGGSKMVVAPVARALINRGDVGRAVYSADGKTLTIIKEEFVKDIIQTTASTAQIDSVTISPNSFPWAKQQGGLFENYEMLACEFKYNPLQATSVTGFLVLAPDMDPTDTHTVQEGKGDLLTMNDSKAGNAWAPMQVRIAKESLSRKGKLFTGIPPTATSETVANQAIARQHLCGKLWIMANTNTSTGGVVGELWVNYAIRFSIPQIVPIKSGELDAFADSARCTGSTNAAPFGTANVYAEGGIPATFSSSGTTTSVTTFTFSEPWSGYVTAWLSTSAGISSIAITGTSSSVEIFEDSSSLSWFAWVDANQNQTLIITVGNTDISSANWIFVRGADRRA